MTGPFYHLAVNHVPLFALFFGICALIWAWVRKSDDMLWAAVGLFVITGVFSWIAKETGHMAAHAIKDLPTFSKEWIHTHAAAAKYAVWWSTVLAVVAVLTLVVQKWKPRFFRAMQIFLLVLALFTLSVILRTAYVGGKVNHAELR
jgi:hypothetical protein